MTEAYLSRRTLLRGGLTASAASLLDRAGSAHQTTGVYYSDHDSHVDAGPQIHPRQQLLFDFDWKFLLGNADDPAKDLGFGFGQSDFSKTGGFEFAKVGFDDSKWRTIDLPHDWAVELPFIHDDSGSGDSQMRSHGYKPLGRRFPETSVGWYRREFDVPDEDLGQRIWVDFDGAFRDTLVFVNGCFVGRHNNGYSPFRFDITDFLNYGLKNCLTLRVDATCGDGWFYPGATHIKFPVI